MLGWLVGYVFLPGAQLILIKIMAVKYCISLDFMVLVLWTIKLGAMQLYYKNHDMIIDMQLK